MATAFPYNKTTPVNSDGFAFNPTQLRTEILKDSGITTTLDWIKGIGKEDVIVNFVTDPSAPEIVVLDGLVAAHVPLDDTPRLAIGFNSNELIFRPGAPIFQAGPTVFSTWSDLIARLDEFKGFSRRAILIDDTFVSPVEIPAGSYDLEDTVLEGINPVLRADVTLVDGVVFTDGPGEILRLDITHEGNSPPITITQDSVEEWSDVDIFCVNSPFLRYTGSITGVLAITGLSDITNSGSPCIEIGDTSANLTLLVSGETTLNSDVLSDVPSANPISISAFGSGNINISQPSLNSFVIDAAVAKASVVSFDPSATATPLVSTDTQAAIEELDANAFAKVFGNSFAHATNDVPVTTTSTTFLSYLALNAVGLEAGLYRIHLWYIWNHDSIANDFEARVTLDGGSLTTQDPFHKQEPKDSIGTDPSGSTQRYVASVTKYANLIAGNHTVDLEFRTDSSNDESTIFEAIIELWRVQ